MTKKTLNFIRFLFSDQINIQNTNFLKKIDQLLSQFFINKSLYIKSIDLVKNQKLLKYIYIYKIKRIRPMQSVY